MDTRIKDSLVMSAFYQAVGREHPNEGLIVHTDQGAQFTSQRFQALLLRYGCKQSMSRKGEERENIHTVFCSDSSDTVSLHLWRLSLVCSLFGKLFFH